MKTRQQFKWSEQFNFETIEKHFLLIPKEVEEFHSLIEKGLNYEYAFTRITGKDIFNKQNVRLVVEYVPDPHTPGNQSVERNCVKQYQGESA